MVTEQNPVVAFTDAAVAKLAEVLKEQDAQSQYLRIAISTTASGGIEYIFGLEEKPSDGDEVIKFGALQAVVDADSLPLLSGSNVDYVEGFQRSGFVISNPNFQSGGCACGGGGCGCGGGAGHGGEMEAGEAEEEEEAVSGGCACGGGGCGGASKGGQGAAMEAGEAEEEAVSGGCACGGGGCGGANKGGHGH